MNGSVVWRAALVQGLAVAMSGVALGVALPHSRRPTPRAEAETA